MAEKLDVNPTKGNLLNLQQQLESIRGRHDLLDRKREVLIRELTSRTGNVKELEQRILDQLRAAHEWLHIARMRLGTDKVNLIPLSPTAHVRANVSVETIMGLRVPSVTIDVKPISPPYGLGDTSAALDEAREKWLDILRFQSEYAGKLSSVYRLTAEVRKTQRQVNALESTVIPRYEATIAYIRERLEESEREDIVHARKVKEMHK